MYDSDEPAETDPEDLVVAEGDLDWTEYDQAGRSFRRKKLAAETAGEDLGCSLYEVDPGSRTWPAHYHEGNEEALFVLSGRGTLRLGVDGETREISPGDYVALPAREEATHALENDGEEVLRLLAVSTQNEPDVIVYPEKEAVGLFAGSAPGGEKAERSLSRYLDANAEVPYWDEAESESEASENDD